MKKPKVKPGRDRLQERAEDAIKKPRRINKRIKEWKAYPVTQVHNIFGKSVPETIADEITKATKETIEQIRRFDTGAIRDTEDNKLDYEAFLSPQAIECFALYMDFHRNMPDGTRRDGDNWQKGFPNLVLIKSMWRHFFSFWRWCRFAYYGDQNKSLVRPFQHPLIDLCGIMFNAQAYIRQMIEADPESMNEMLRTMKLEREQKLRLRQ